MTLILNYSAIVLAKLLQLYLSILTSEDRALRTVYITWSKVDNLVFPLGFFPLGLYFYSSFSFVAASATPASPLSHPTTIMPALQNYDVLLDLTNDMHDLVSIQLLRDYGRQSGRIVLLNPAETLTLILESGCSYHYAVKSHTKVANVTCVDVCSVPYFLPDGNKYLALGLGETLAAAFRNF